MHKFKTYEVCIGVIKELKAVILEKVEAIWIEELEDEMIEYFNVSIQDMIEHLYKHGGVVEMYNKETMMHESNHSWEWMEHPVAYFNHVEKAKK